MLKEHLNEKALKFFNVPEQYELFIDEITDEKTMLLWKDVNSVDDYYIELGNHGNLLSLSQPPIRTDERISVKKQQQIVEQFLTSQYAEALHYYTLTKVIEQVDRTRFQFEQLVGGYPLAHCYCFIEIAPNGYILNFKYRGYTKNPPCFPKELAPKELILSKLYEADWTPKISYLSSKSYSVPTSGLYVLYESPKVYHTYDADIETCTFDREYDETLDMEKELFVPMPTVAPQIPEKSIESIIGITPSMEIARQALIEENTRGIVWREKDWQALLDNSRDSYLEVSVKAKIDTSTNQLKGFVWFKERTGNLNLTYKKCRYIALSFITTYYREYVPYLQMKLDEPLFNESQRACFMFSVTVDDHPLESEFFMITVNKTTGFIDMLMTPNIDISEIEAFKLPPLLPLSEAKYALIEVDANLKWVHHDHEDEDEDGPSDVLKYEYGHHKTKQSIRGINAVTGELILMK